jgi:regulator of nonsense transcripts 2
MDLFLRQLLYLDMTKRNYTKILKTIRKLHWEEPEVSSFNFKQGDVH